MPRQTLALSLFWRTFVLLALLLGGGIFAWVQTLRALEFEPRAVQAAQQLASLVNLARAGLRYADNINRVTLVKTISDQEAVRLLPREPTDMGYEELGEYIATLERAGGDVDKLRVERALKIAIPVTCIIIVLFGAPLATSTQRGGAAYGVAVSLGTTIIFLVLIQLTKAIGGSGLVRPELAAWMPSALFGLVGLILLARVRT